MPSSPRLVTAPAYAPVAANAHTAVLACAAIAAALAAVAAAPAAVIVRDAPGGETASGGVPGLYTAGTGGNIIATLIDDPFFADPAIGQFDFQADYGLGRGFEPLATYCISPLKTTEIPLFEDNPAGLDGFSLIALADQPGLTAQEVGYVQALWFHAFAGSAVDKLHAAAFQLILWELAIDDGLSALSLTSGAVRVDLSDPFTASVAALANTYIDNLTGAEPVWSQQTPLFVLTHPTSQEILTTVPEPAALALVALGSLGALMRRRAAR